jgi:hypothetical protein
MSKPIQPWLPLAPAGGGTTEELQLGLRRRFEIERAEGLQLDAALTEIWAQRQFAANDPVAFFAGLRQQMVDAGIKVDVDEAIRELDS